MCIHACFFNRGLGCSDSPACLPASLAEPLRPNMPNSREASELHTNRKRLRSESWHSVAFGQQYSLFSSLFFLNFFLVRLFFSSTRSCFTLPRGRKGVFHSVFSFYDRKFFFKVISTFLIKQANLIALIYRRPAVCTDVISARLALCSPLQHYLLALTSGVKTSREPHFPQL